MAPTYFGEVNDLDSRAVWYSDEEDDDEENLCEEEPTHPGSKCSMSHESMRSCIELNFKRSLDNPPSTIRDCIISLISTSKFKNFKTVAGTGVLFLGQYENLAKVFVCPLAQQTRTSEKDETTLWLMFDQNAPQIIGAQVAYLVEALRQDLYTVLGLAPSSPVIILTKQFSDTEHLEYLSNHIISENNIQLPFVGRACLPPGLVRNSFESSLFEQLTLTLKLVYVVCLPDPRNYWFDRTGSWPSIPNQIIELKLNDDNLENTLIFT